MIVITNKGEYAKVNKVMSNHYEIKYFNGKMSLINRNSCEVLVLESELLACKERLNLAQRELKKMHEKLRITNAMAQNYIEEYKKYKTDVATGAVIALREFLRKFNQ